MTYQTGQPFVVPPTATTWVPTTQDTDFSIQNLPFGWASLEDETETIVVRIGDFALNLCALSEANVIPKSEFPDLGSLHNLDKDDVRRLRTICYELLRHDEPLLRDQAILRSDALIPCSKLEMLTPVAIPAYVDFYSGIHHASNVGKMFRPNMPPLLPNYRHLPVAYNGRASTVTPSPTLVQRPYGQIKPPGEEPPVFAPTRELDFELELGFFISEGNPVSGPISINDAENHMLGVVLVNDWSARDVQRWEYQPLGPFLAKSFCTSISPWIVTMDALEPFRRPGPTQDPAPLGYLTATKPGHFDIRLEIALQTTQMTKPQIISRTAAEHLYWSFAQQLAHVTSNGTVVEFGDLYASGTISGPDEGSFGSMLELAWRATKPIAMAETGEQRTFLEDGDTIVMRGYCQGDGFRVGFGELEGTVTPSN